MATQFALASAPATGTRTTLPSGEVMEWNGTTWVKAVSRVAYGTEMRKQLKNFQRALLMSSSRILNIRQIGTSIAYGSGDGWLDVGSTFVRSLQREYGASGRTWGPFASQSSAPVNGWMVQFYGGTYTVRLRGVAAASPTKVVVPKGSKSFTVVYSKETDGGTITVHKSIDGGLNWTSTTSIDCNGTSALGQVQAYTVNLEEHTIFRFTPPATNAGYLEYWCIDANDTGIAYANWAYGGSSLRMHAGTDTRAPFGDMYQTSKTPSGDQGLSTTFAPTATVNKPDLVIYSGPTNDSGAPTEWETNFPAAMAKVIANGSSCIVIIEPINTTADDNGTYRGWWDQARDVIYETQALYPDNIFIFDWDRFLSESGHFQTTWNADGVHPSRVKTEGDPYLSGGHALCQMFGIPTAEMDVDPYGPAFATEYTQATEPPNAAVGSIWNDTSNAAATLPKVLIARPGPFDQTKKGLWQCLNGLNTRVIRLDDGGTEYGSLTAATNMKGEPAWALHTTTATGFSVNPSLFVADEIYTLSLTAELDAGSDMPITLSFGNFPNYLSLDPFSGKWITIIDAGPRTGAGGSAGTRRNQRVVRHAQTFKWPSSAELAAATAAGVTIGNLIIRFDTPTFGVALVWKDMKIERGASMTTGISSSLLAGPHTFTGQQVVSPVTLTSASTVATDCSKGNNFHLTLGTNATLGLPTNMVAGGVYNWWIKQDVTGSRTMAYHSVFKWPGGVAPVLSTVGGSVDFISGYYDGTNILANCAKGYA